MAQRAEAACIDFMFLADILAHQDLPPDVLCHTELNIHNFEPVSLLSALAVVTSRIWPGRIGVNHLRRAVPCRPHVRNTRSPQQWPRGMESRHIDSRFRSAQFRFGRTPAAAGTLCPRRGIPRHCRRALGQALPTMLFIHDKAAGICFDPAKLRPLNYVGKHFRVKGPLPFVTTAQGRPVIMQAAHPMRVSR